MNARTVVTILAAILALPVAAEQLVTTVRLDAVDGVLRIDAADRPSVRVVAELAEPGITRPVYAVTGMVRYEDVAGDGYLQLDSDFAGRGTYFTKSLADSGPLRKLTGSSEWRPFVLPFYANQDNQSTSAPLPDALTLSVVLPSGGAVSLRDVALYEYDAGENPLAAFEAWPGTRIATWVGAVGGTLVGIWGGLIGLLASRGKARRFAIASANVLFIAGFAILALGVYAFAGGQPYAAWYPLGMLGIILVVVVGVLRRLLPRRYEAVELQKMKSMDA